MLSKIKNNYNHTIYASYIAYIVQAINNNFAPLLFLTFATDYELSLDKITLITTINFLVQLLVDLISAKPEQYKFFQFSILQLLEKTVTADEVIQTESLWKKKLQPIQ